MKNSLTSALILLMAVSAGTAHAQTSQKLSAGKATEYGLVYSLPVTAIDIYLEAELTEEHPGEFHNYARRHLGVNNAITKDSRTARLKSATIVPRGIADPEQKWLAQFKIGSAPFMILDEAGVPLAINTENIPAAEVPTVPEAVAAAPSPLETEAARQAVTQDMARSSSTSKKAELAAQRIFELRETRSDILSGQADNPPADGKAMELVLDNLSAQEAALTAMFCGTRSISTVVEKITVVPDSDEVKGDILARLSAVEGIIDSKDLAGAPITLNIKILEKGELPTLDNGTTKSFPKGGVAYRIPGTALISIDYDGQTIASKEVSLAQLGVVFGLDPKLFTDKKAPSMVLFEPATGAILEIGTATAVQ